MEELILEFDPDVKSYVGFNFSFTSNSQLVVKSSYKFYKYYTETLNPGVYTINGRPYSYYERSFVTEDNETYIVNDITIGSTEGYEIIAFISTKNNVTIPSSFTYVDELEQSHTKNVIAIGKGGFEDIIAQSIILPSTIKFVSDDAFNGKGNTLQNIYVDNSNTKYFDVDGVLFANVGTQVSLVFYPIGRTDSVFSGYSFDRVNADAFCGNNSITTIYLPANIKEINASAFNNCNALYTIVFKGTTLPLINGILPNNITSILVPLSNYNDYLDADSFEMYSLLLESYKTVIFEPNNNEDTTAVLVKDGESLVAIAEPSKENYTFAGWYTDDATFANAWDFENGVLVNQTTTLYAKWE